MRDQVILLSMIDQIMIRTQKLKPARSNHSQRSRSAMTSQSYLLAQLKKSAVWPAALLLQAIIRATGGTSARQWRPAWKAAIG